MAFIYSKILECMSDNAYWPAVSLQSNTGQKEYVLDCFLLIQ